MCTSLLYTFMDVLSALLLKLIKNKIKIAKVVVRIPPPTELGKEPINIKIPMIIFVGSLSVVTSIV